MPQILQPALQNMMKNAKTIRAKELSSLLDNYAGKVKVLSLDCFDTILWRKTATPRDLFYDLQKKPTFQALGFTGALRISAEGRARQMLALRHGTSEVKLSDIYREGFHELSAEQIDLLMREELEAEKEVCYAFPPVVELIRKAHEKNIKIAIVSDTYLDEQQLRELLSKTLPTELLAYISNIFCSCEYGKAKTSGIFSDVIQQLKCSAEDILHVGDNIIADYVMPSMFNIKALHFVHHDEYVVDLMRLQDTSARMLDPAIAASRSLSSPFRAVLALNAFAADNPEKAIGYASLGPIMYAFADFINREISGLKKQGKNLKVIFLMRDAYLPSLACEAYIGKEIGKRIRISRFASYAASFCTLADIDNYLVEIGNTNRLHDVARQLLLPNKVAEPLIKAAMRRENPAAEFFKSIRRQDIVRIILKKSAEYRSRLMLHLQNEVGLAPGVTLMLVDLGYSGTAQRRLTPLFKEMNIDIIGRYLLSLRIPGWEHNRRGLIDPSWCDDRAMQTIVVYIMLLEQLCTSNEKSVIDYDEKGNPIYSSVMMSEAQHNKLQRIQAECLQFVRDASQFFRETTIEVSSEMLRQAALAELTRMIFLPTETELQYLKTFQAEVNLGTDDVLRVFDPEQGLIGLRRRGMFYMERPSKSTRTNYPAELRSAGIELVLSLIAQHRFGLDLKLKDMVLRKEYLQVVFHQGGDVYKTITDAVATHDGFFAIWLPTQFQTSIILGENYRWIQMESAELIPMEAFVNQTETKHTIDVSSKLIFAQVTNHDDKLFEMQSNESAVMMNPVNTDKNQFVLRFVFRPLVKRAEQVSNKLLNVG